MKVIDLAGPQGNAWMLMGLAESWSKQLGDPPEVIEAMMVDMQSGDYDHLVEVFEQKFQHIAELIYPEPEDGEE